MKKLYSIILASVIGLTAASAQAKDTLRIGVEGAYPPFSFKQADGSLSGFDIEIANAICDAMNRECKLVEQEWDGMIAALNSRKYDAIVASMSITPDRMKRVSFSEKYYNNLVRVVAAKNSDLEVSQAGMAGKSLGVVRGTTHQCYTEKHLSNANIKLYNTHEDLYADLLIGRVDARISDVTEAAAGFLKTPEGQDYKFVGANLTDSNCFGEGIGIAVRKNDKLVNELNQAIKDIRASGIYQQISNKYFSVDIYGE